MLAKAAVFILGILINYLESHKVNLSDRLHQIAAAIGSAAPHLAQVASEAESAIVTIAPVVAASFPGHGAASVANELAAAAAVAQQVQGAIVGAVSGNGAPTPGTASPTPVADVSGTTQSAEDAAATAAAAASVTAQAAASPSALETRLQLVESALFEMLPALAGVLKAFGK
jgi:hypothetical protein